LKNFEDYKTAVVLAYESKKTEGILPPNLQRNTPAKLKKECLNEFSGRYSARDNQSFLSLFGKGNNAEEFYHLIRLADPDIFRPLNSFLSKKTLKTAEENVELLAWLIDFEPRPYKPADYRDIGKPERESTSITNAAPVTEKERSDDKLENKDVGEPEILTPPDDKVNLKEDETNLPPESIIDPPAVGNGTFGIPAKFNKFLMSHFAVSCLMY